MKKKSLKDVITDVGMIASIVTEHYFESLYENTEIGAAECYATIAEFARQAEIKTRNIKEWETYVDKLNNKEISCWDDYMLFKAREYFLKKHKIKVSF